MTSDRRGSVLPLNLSARKDPRKYQPKESKRQGVAIILGISPVLLPVKRTCRNRAAFRRPVTGGNPRRQCASSASGTATWYIPPDGDRPRGKAGARILGVSSLRNSVVVKPITTEVKDVVQSHDGPENSTWGAVVLGF